jgi:hypothetical protein
VGFITVLCIGNYFRAKRAQERQRQRRLTKLAAAGIANNNNNDPTAANNRLTTNGIYHNEPPSHGTKMTAGSNISHNHGTYQAPAGPLHAITNPILTESGVQA